MIVVAPAHRALYGSLDKAFGHLRRYEKAELETKIREAGFEIERLYFHNILRAVAWFWKGRGLGRKRLARFQAQLFDWILPVVHRVESCMSVPFGLSLIGICPTVELARLSEGTVGGCEGELSLTKVDELNVGLVASCSLQWPTKRRVARP